MARVYHTASLGYVDRIDIFMHFTAGFSCKTKEKVVSGLFSLDGKIVLITGACGKLGLEFSRACAASGARIALCDLAPGEAVAAELSHALGVEVEYFNLDVTSRKSGEDVLSEIESMWGSVPDVLVNNAGIDSPPNALLEENGSFEEYSFESWERVMRVNLTGPFLMSQVFGGAMAQAGRGVIINISSIYGVIGPDQSLYDHRVTQEGRQFYKPVAYSASKAGLIGLTKYLASYWRGKVRVNAVVLGGVRSNQDPAFLAKYEKKTLVGRMAQSDEYNGLVVFLASDAASYLTGSCVTADGGFTAL